MMYTADFETIAYNDDGITKARIWAWAICSIDNPQKITIGNTMESFMEWIEKSDRDNLYFHNLKFDQSYIIDYIERHGYTHSTAKNPPADRTYTTLISDMGQCYKLDIITKKHEHKPKGVCCLDSFKLLPFSVDVVAKSFGLPISKLTIDYKAYREYGHTLTQEETEYIKHDVQICAMALKQLFSQGLKKITTASNALSWFKADYSKLGFRDRFPALPIPIDADIRQSYRGGFTYLKPEYADKDLGKMIVLDVNSLYPWAMYNNPFPVDEPVYFDGKYQFDKKYPLYVQMFSCYFEVKPCFLPTIQLKHGYFFSANEYITTTFNKKVGAFTECTMCLTNVDLRLFLDHYNAWGITWKCGWKFKASTGIFTNYIDYWMNEKIKATEEGNKGKRTISKLMLNSLYGKFGLKPDCISKQPYLDEKEDVIKYRRLDPEIREPLYIPIASFVTAYARNKTIRSAQSVYDRFVYADTDSLHLLGSDIPENLDIDPVKLGAWKHESSPTKARFIRQKTYIEEINGKLQITCAGMPKSCHDSVTWENFHPGAVYHGKLLPKTVPGGIILEDTDFTIKI